MAEIIIYKIEGELPQGKVKARKTKLYATTIAGLQLCLSTRARLVCSKTDSQLVAYQYKGDYKVRESTVVKYLPKIKQLTSHLQSFTVDLVPREKCASRWPTKAG
ncbi:Ribonuclease HI [Bienertia sinuspersici]